MNDMSENRRLNFLFGIVVGTIVSFILSLLFVPQSGSDTRAMVKSQQKVISDKFTSDRDIFSQRIRSATSDWLQQLRSTVNDMVDKGYLSTDEANAQINRLLERVRGNAVPDAQTDGEN